MTSEGARQYRHRAIALDGLIFTNLAPEHIESHGSLEAYADAKFDIGRQLVRSSKRPRIIVASSDDAEGPRYLTLPVETRLPFSLDAHKPFASDEQGGYFHFLDTSIHIHLPGDFSLKNAIAAATLAQALPAGRPGSANISVETIASALGKIQTIPGRAERIEAGQDFTVVVDYAHTPDSLTALYDAYDHTRKICVLGSTGGGRDLWKRPVMGGIADARCDHVILTNEDPYDEDPRSIIDDLAHGMRRAPEIIMDRREAIARALSLAHAGDAVLISGKGTDPCICGPQGSKTPWSDAAVAREELQKRATSKSGIINS
jgi:UDP-N-acetylmuramoyl-L-alanyl-D-glutamate--2,6-diaminopimelate ligase